MDVPAILAEMEGARVEFDTTRIVNPQTGSVGAAIFLRDGVLEALMLGQGRVEAREGAIVFVQDCRDGDQPA